MGNLQMTHSLMTDMNDELNRSSEGILNIKDVYGSYARALQAATQALGELKKKSEADSTVIMYSFIFFMASVAFWGGSTVVSLTQTVSGGVSRVLAGDIYAVSLLLGLLSICFFFKFRSRRNKRTGRS